MKKKALLTGVMLMIAVAATDSPSLNVSKLFAGNQTWTLEEFSSSLRSLQTVPAAGFTATSLGGDYYICKELPGGFECMIISLSGEDEWSQDLDRELAIAVRVMSP